jgi:hypothetical protein
LYFEVGSFAATSSIVARSICHWGSIAIALNTDWTQASAEVRSWIGNR